MIKILLIKLLNIVEIKNKNILEIGPGTGNLTSQILKKKPKKLTVIEKDDYLSKTSKKNLEKE